MQVYLISLLALSLIGCTILITQTDTHGVANDVVDETSRTDPKIDATIPLSFKP